MIFARHNHREIGGYAFGPIMSSQYQYSLISNIFS